MTRAKVENNSRPSLFVVREYLIWLSLLKQERKHILNCRGNVPSEKEYFKVGQFSPEALI